MSRWKRLAEKVWQVEPASEQGLITKIVGLTIEARGPAAGIGEYCQILTRRRQKIPAEVVGFNGNTTVLMPLGELEGISPGDHVIPQRRKLAVRVGPELLGRILDGLGKPFGGMPYQNHITYPLLNKPPNALDRPRIHEPLSVGVRAIDGMITVGRGQRMGIFSGSGVGKSTLLGMMARNTAADINVIALIGERGRELREFIEKDLGPEGLARSVVVVATSDQPALIRIKAAYTATAIAEYFRDRGQEVLLLMDSLTRFAMAQREVGLAAGEPPTTRGYPPSVFALLPKLLERSGMAAQGSITGIYTVLVDGDDHNEPIADALRGMLDGHIVLTRELAISNHYPAIDVLQSISRVMRDVVSPEHLELAAAIRRHLAVYHNAKDLIDIGAYSAGSNPAIDQAINLVEKINGFLRQGAGEAVAFDHLVAIMKEILTV